MHTITQCDTTSVVAVKGGYAIFLWLNSMVTLLLERSLLFYEVLQRVLQWFRASENKVCSDYKAVFLR